MHAQKPDAFVLWVLAAGAALAPLAAADIAVVPGQVSVRTHDGERTFLIGDTWAETSTATLIGAARPDKSGAAPSSIEGIRLSNRVVVRAATDDAVRELERFGLGYEVSAFARLDGFYVVTGVTVDDAIWASSFLSADASVAEVYVDIDWPKTLRTVPSDPSFPSQWYLRNGNPSQADSNVEPVWTAGYTGAGVVVGILEGGWEITHLDLAGNYNAAASQTGTNVSSHGTSVAGVVGMVAGNDIGGAGAAYGAQISRLYYGGTTSNATAFEYRNDLNDIKNNSWGPSDNGRLHTMSSIEHAALENSVNTGRGGLGEIFVWAAGNGGLNDRVDYDPFASSRFTIPVGGVGNQDVRSDFNELGSSHFVVAHTAGNGLNVFTTGIGNSFNPNFGGTSAAAPHGAGVIALMLDANPNLTWRDVQHILVQTARKNDAHNPGWTTNGAGHDISYDYGYGALDAEAAVNAALGWTTVAPEVSSSKTVVANLPVPDDDPNGVTVDVCVRQSIDVESVELILNATSTYVGDLRITLTSPRGTESVLATPRSDARQDLVDYRFTSRRHFGEWSSGTWTVHIADEAAEDLSFLQDATVIVYGIQGPISCSSADLTTTGAAQGEPMFGVPDGQITGADIQYFVNRWIALELCVADVDAQGVPEGDPMYGVPDGEVTGADLLYYVNVWIFGCP